jgi:hypothetical protein
MEVGWPGEDLGKKTWHMVGKAAETRGTSWRGHRQEPWEADVGVARHGCCQSRAGSGDPAYKGCISQMLLVGRVPSRGGGSDFGNSLGLPGGAGVIELEREGRNGLAAAS